MFFEKVSIDKYPNFSAYAFLSAQLGCTRGNVLGHMRMQIFENRQVTVETPCRGDLFFVHRDLFECKAASWLGRFRGSREYRYTVRRSGRSGAQFVERIESDTMKVEERFVNGIDLRAGTNERRMLLPGQTYPRKRQNSTSERQHNVPESNPGV